MSLRDTAAALGISKSELHRWKQLADIPEDDFENRMTEVHASGHRLSASAVLQPVPARGRVQRALALWRGMTDEQRQVFMALISSNSENRP